MIKQRWGDFLESQNQAQRVVLSLLGIELFLSAIQWSIVLSHWRDAPHWRDLGIVHLSILSSLTLYGLASRGLESLVIKFVLLYANGMLLVYYVLNLAIPDMWMALTMLAGMVYIYRSAAELVSIKWMWGIMSGDILMIILSLFIYSRLIVDFISFILLIIILIREAREKAQYLKLRIEEQANYQLEQEKIRAEQHALHHTQQIDLLKLEQERTEKAREALVAENALQTARITHLEEALALRQELTRTKVVNITLSQEKDSLSQEVGRTSAALQEERLKTLELTQTLQSEQITRLALENALQEVRLRNLELQHHLEMAETFRAAITWAVERKIKQTLEGEIISPLKQDKIQPDYYIFHLRTTYGADITVKYPQAALQPRKKRLHKGQSATLFGILSSFKHERRTHTFFLAYAVEVDST